jgi:hypothetical protein
MLATFCLRLACGLTAALLVLSPKDVAPRFYRTQFLTVLGLTAAAAVLLRDSATATLWIALGAALGLSFLGSFVWSLEGAPAGLSMIVLDTLALLAGLALEPANAALAGTAGSRTLLFLNQATSAVLLGTATSAMLMGHSYLIAPAMSITPLMRLLIALFVATALRMLAAGVGLWCWTEQHPLGSLAEETYLWLPLRWGVGFIGPLVFGWMARESARIRSTQSATGILYVVVVFCFLGELTSQLLQPNGFPL